jgi:N-methylhydantoinase A
VRCKIGIDVGGTFTDFLVTDPQGGATAYKTPTTPQHPEVGVFHGLEKIAANLGLGLRAFLTQVEAIVHGTTITTNAVLTGEGAKTGFLTTKGFRDILNMRRGLKERQYDSKYSPPLHWCLATVSIRSRNGWVWRGEKSRRSMSVTSAALLTGCGPTGWKRWR